jgi:hypothetical protein
LVNNEWLALQDHAAIQHLEYNHSDHRPLLLDTEFYAPLTIPVTKQFHFEDKWLIEDKFREVVKEQWTAAANKPGVIDVLGRLKAMHAGLHACDYRVLKNPKQQLRKAQRDLDMIMRGPINDVNQAKKFELGKQIEKLLEQEEIKWSQQSRANWLQNGGKNTKYLHNFASNRKK